MKINVLFVIIQMAMGGSERLVYNISRKIDRSSFAPHIAWFYGTEIPHEFRELDIPLFHVPKTKRFDLSTMAALGGIIRDNNIHVVNAHHFLPMVYSYYGSKLSNRSRLVYTEHSRWEIERISWKWRKVGHRLLRNADAVVGVSKGVSEKLQETFGFDPSRSHTIVNGVELSAFGRTSDRRALKKELGISESDRVIGVVANLKKIKNHIFLLRAFKELSMEHGSVKLLLVGQGFSNDPENSEREVRDFIEDNGLDRKVIMTGYRPDVLDLLGIMDIFCLTSHREGLPISLIEAMAAGLPAVGTDVDGINDVIRHQVNGLLVPSADVQQLTGALSALVANDSMRGRMGTEAASTARNDYSLSTCVERHQELFSSLT